MKIRQSHSQIIRKCVVCGKETGDAKIYDDGGLSIRVAVCDGGSNCRLKVEIKKSVVSMFHNLREEINELRGVAQ